MGFEISWSSEFETGIDIIDQQHRRLFDYFAEIEAAIADELVDRAIEAIEGAARTGKIGDGKIFISNVEQVVRIRTGETGARAV